ncbi:hypothetical protein C9422_31345, partial [Pseudomonas sp. B1(2018)]
NAALLRPSRASSLLQSRSSVGAGLPAMVVNDDACLLAKRGALETLASKLAPTVAVFCGSWLASDGR